MKTALITGGSRGVGAATVAAFQNAGYQTAFFYRSNGEAARKVAEETGALPFPCDVADPNLVRAACEAVLARFRHIDALVNNAGIAQQKLFTDITDEEWARMLGVNLSGAFYVTRALLPSMLSRNSGRIVNVSSVWGTEGASCEVHYSAAKAGLIGLTKALAREVGPSGVTVNCVCPGVVDTDMLNCFSKRDLQALREETPLGRLGQPAEIASAVLWLCGDGAGFVTGQVLGVDGGFR